MRNFEGNALSIFWNIEEKCQCGRCQKWTIFSEIENEHTENVGLYIEQEQAVWGMRISEIQKKIGSKALNAKALRKMLENDALPESLYEAKNIFFLGTVFTNPHEGLAIMRLKISTGGEVPAWDDYFHWVYDIDFVPLSSVVIGYWNQSAIYV